MSGAVLNNNSKYPCISNINSNNSSSTNTTSNTPSTATSTSNEGNELNSIAMLIQSISIQNEIKAKDKIAADKSKDSHHRHHKKHRRHIYEGFYTYKYISTLLV